jgi:glutathione S-transferase
MKNLCYYYNPGSVFSNVGALMIHEKGIQDQVEFKPIKMGVDNIAPWYISLNPRGQVPTLVHDDNAIPDTLAIASYLDKAFPSNPLFLADEPEVMDKVEQWRQTRVLSLIAGKKTPTQDVQKTQDNLAQSREQVLAYAREHPELAEAYKTRLAIHDNRAHMLVDHDAHLLHKQRWAQLLTDTEAALETRDSILERGRSAVDVYAVSILYWATQKMDAHVLDGWRNIKRFYLKESEKDSFKQAFNKS